MIDALTIISKVLDLAGENRTNIVGFLLVKKLIGLPVSDNGILVRVGDVALNQPLVLGCVHYCIAAY